MIKSEMTKRMIFFHHFKGDRNRTHWRKGIKVYHPFPAIHNTRRRRKQARFSQLRRLALRKECACVGGKFVSFDELSDYERRMWLEG